MRIATRTIFNQSNVRLGNQGNKVNKANEVVSSGKRINRIADDPVGLSQVMTLNSSLKNLDQLNRNMITGKTWLTSGESTIEAVKDMIDEALHLCIAIKNGALTQEDVASAADQVDGYLEQLEELANTRVNGQYIFSGTKTDIKPFAYDKKNRPTKVLYSGNNSEFSIKSGRDTKVQSGHDGESLFRNKQIRVDVTNDKIDFKESMSAGKYGAELTAIIPSGLYSPTDLAAVIEATMESRSAQGFDSEILRVSNPDAEVIVHDYSALKISTPHDVPFTLEYSGLIWHAKEGTDPNIPGVNIVHHLSGPDKITIDVSGNGEADLTVNFLNNQKPGDALELDIKANPPGVNSGNGIDYEVNYNANTGTFRIEQNAFAETKIADLELLWKTGSNAGQSIAPDIGFEVVDVRDALVSDNKVSSFEITETGNEIRFVEVSASGTPAAYRAVITPGVYSSGEELASEIQKKMTDLSFGINYEVKYDTDTERFIIKEDGDVLKSLTIDWKNSSAHESLGYDNKTDIYTKPQSTERVQWGVFDTLIDFKYYLEMADIDGIDRTITRLQTDLDHMISEVSGIGANIKKIDTKESILTDLNISYRLNRSELEDADILDAISDLQLKENAYRASLASSSRVMKTSLVDHI